MPEPDRQPIGEINTTPLIDVMLVLLIMFVITIPVATHSVEVELPRDCNTCPPVDALKNTLAIDRADRLLWNGAPVNEAQLGALLVESHEMPVEPELRFEPAALASYAASARALRLIDASGVSKFGFVGNEKYRTFARR